VYPSVDCYQAFDRPLLINKNGKDTRTMIKDNVIALKKPERIEVLGMILLIALLIWRLIERCMRQYVENNNTEITGREDRSTENRLLL
jgi:transposase